MIYVIIQNSGHQYKVHPGQFIKMPKLSLPEGSPWKCQHVLAFQSEGGDMVVGSPFINKMEISGKICRHGKYKKVMVFKKKRRKGYRFTKGHRQEFTEIYIESITDSKGTEIAKKIISKGKN